MLSALAALHSSASALSLTSSLSASSASSRAAVVRMDDIPMVKAPTAVKSADREPFSCSFEIPKKGISEYGTVNMNFKPILTESELVMVTYELPFGLAAEPRGRVVAVTKDGEGGEKEGDILRFTLEWQGGEAQPAMFDVCSCMERRLDSSFDEVVKALTSNDGMCTLPPSPPPAQLPVTLPCHQHASHTATLHSACADANEIVMIFERPLAGSNVNSLQGEVV